MTAEWQNGMAEARAATGFTGNVIQRTVDSIGVALRLDRRAAFYGELGSLPDSGGFEAFLTALVRALLVLPSQGVPPRSPCPVGHRDSARHPTGPLRPW
ncbi:hypothetical protein GCM10022403_032330 [Streptomyces coacervatus]|uniref:Transposase n=1 Tax=Streptomyces coacervatus TaxID=647381 RepID=A0ABP7HMM1_9ACTN|nr:hypothetical protein [Streptomyces coacervatus]MDF2272422.1 hypothetical protein [Streptomyces coacervatus]